MNDICITLFDEKHQRNSRDSAKKMSCPRWLGICQYMLAYVSICLYMLVYVRTCWYMLVVSMYIYMYIYIHYIMQICIYTYVYVIYIYIIYIYTYVARNHQVSKYRTNSTTRPRLISEDLKDMSGQIVYVAICVCHSCS